MCLISSIAFSSSCIQAIQICSWAVGMLGMFDPGGRLSDSGKGTLSVPISSGHAEISQLTAKTLAFNTACNYISVYWQQGRRLRPNLDGQSCHISGSSKGIQIHTIGVFVDSEATESEDNEEAGFPMAMKARAVDTKQTLLNVYPVNHNTQWWKYEWGLWYCLQLPFLWNHNSSWSVETSMCLTILLCAITM